ncbi:MAG TPA: hypothetical protein PLD60_10310 [Leptospiraceae bacterium]|nr:hypothetical protein [Leptospiraceae bacterium]
MVIDAGSSGTRICLYGIRTEGNECHAVDTDFACKDVPAENGLADIGPERAEQTVNAALQMVEPQSSRIKGAVLLGTGGFRRATQDRQTTVMRAAGSALLTKGYPAVLKVIPGEEEGRLAWYSIAETTGSKAHATLEIGGATVQMAVGIGKNVRAVSTSDGMNDSLKKLGDASACLRPGTKESHEVCVTEIRDRIFLNSRLSDFAMNLSREEKVLPLYGLGAPWNAVFKRSGKQELTLKEIEQNAQEICSKSVEELARSIPLEYAKRSCYLHSYASELLRITGQTRIKRGSESWPRGASIAKEYFSDCR